jgi:hypothetical protein
MNHHIYKNFVCESEGEKKEKKRFEREEKKRKRRKNSIEIVKMERFVVDESDMLCVSYAMCVQ